MWYSALQKEEGEEQQRGAQCDGERIELVAEYKYLGHVLSELLGSKCVLEERAKA